MAIAAAVIGDGGTMSAAGALIEMTAEGGGTTPANGQQYFDVFPTEPVAISFDEGISCGSNQLARLMIRHNIGCRVEETLHIKKIDEEFFE
jgi:hypothetical protein